AHVHELRKRLFIIALSVGLFAGIAYSIEKQLTAFLLQPAGTQQFIYTTPGGGFDFLFKLCLYAGIAASIPVIVYQLFRYLQPLLKYEGRRFMLTCTLWSSILAVSGIAFGYFAGLPPAMKFLLQGFSSDQISALITIQSYMSFVLVYLLGAALLFQLPLILLLINRIKPLSPRSLIQMKYQRWVIVGALIVGAVVSPTPDIRNQLMLSIPVILMYEISIVLIWVRNRHNRRSRKVMALLKEDTLLQVERMSKFKEAQMALRQKEQTGRIANPQTAVHVSRTPAITKQTIPSPVAAALHAKLTPTVAPPNITSVASASSADITPAAPTRPARYIQDFRRQPYSLMRRQIS
ncbi:MAG: twin-arginine translocase subunit TatC, partial [Candidatus Saccharimonadales bacterium]